MRLDFLRADAPRLYQDLFLLTPASVELVIDSFLLYLALHLADFLVYSINEVMLQGLYALYHI